MPSKSSSYRHLAILVGLVLAPCGPLGAATPDEDDVDDATVNKIIELNKKALLAYDALEVESASALLHQALSLCQGARLDKHPVAARTHLHLGVVYISGLKFPELGEAEFRAALAIDPKIQLTQSLLNPEVQAAFEEAQWWEQGPAGGPKHLPFPTGKEPAAEPSAPGTAGENRIFHPPVTQAIQGQAVEIKAQVPPGLGAAKIILAYLAEDGDDFLAREMTPMEDRASWFHEFIPVEATQGRQVSYYIEAKDGDDQYLAGDGSPEAPHDIALAPETRAAAPAPRGADGRAEASPRLASGLWLVFAVGGGGGYHRGSPEMNPKDASGERIGVSGFGPAQLLHVAPEIGFLLRDNLVFSVQGRFQYVTGTQHVLVGKRTYQPATLASAGLAKVTWLGPRGSGKLQPLVSAMFGAGQIRHSITTPASANLTGCGPEPTCKDTMLGGLGLVGAGAGLRLRLGESLGLYAAVELLAGFPSFMLNADVNAGVVVVR
ncbi:MAG: hypothetical protein JXP73_17635 [Deltaproteobacteria bacterium]|nr:hypothetical protein [Deltaproteobacteria bacterium]